MDYLLTIAIPTYNGARTIGHMLELLLPQCDERVEVIVCDNCSTDETPRIVAEFKKAYPITYIRNKVNIGADANFLKCMRLASGRFTYLLSDDDIFIEGKLGNVLNFLEMHPDVALVYLDSVGFNEEYNGIEYCHRYPEHVKKVREDIITADRRIFMDYALRMWGFLSSFLWRTDKTHIINNPEQYYGTFWLQSYIHINCVLEENDLLGVVKGPCLAAGEYHGLSKLDVIQVDGINYKNMLDYAVEHAYFNKKQLYNFYVWRFCFLSKVTIIKEKECNLHHTSKTRLFKMMYTYPQAWIQLFPYMLVPRWVVLLRKKILRTKSNDIVKREGDNVG